MTTEHNEHHGSAKKSSLVKKTLIPLGILIGAILLALFIIQSLLPTQKTIHTRGPQVDIGEILPSFSLTSIQGKPVPINETAGKITMLNFWASWCEACMDEMPSIVKLWEKYHPSGFQVLSINLDENPESMAFRTQEQYKIRFPIFKDPQGSLAEFFDIHGIPLTVVINSERRVLFLYDGGLDWFNQEMQTKLEHWLKQ